MAGASKRTRYVAGSLLRCIEKRLGDCDRQRQPEFRLVPVVWPLAVLCRMAQAASAAAGEPPGSCTPFCNSPLPHLILITRLARDTTFLLPARAAQQACTGQLSCCNAGCVCAPLPHPSHSPPPAGQAAPGRSHLSFPYLLFSRANPAACVAWYSPTQGCGRGLAAAG